MAIKVWLPENFKDKTFKQSSGIYSLVGTVVESSDSKPSEVIVLNAVKTGELKSHDVVSMCTSNPVDTSLLSSLIAGVHLLGVLIVLHDLADKSKGDANGCQLSTDRVKSFLSKLLLDVHFQLNDLNRSTSIVTGLFLNKEDGQLQSIAVRKVANKVDKVADVILCSTVNENLKSIRPYCVSLALDLTISAPNFADYNFVLESVNQELDHTFDPERCVVVSNSKVMNSTDLISKHVTGFSEYPFSFEVCETAEKKSENCDETELAKTTSAMAVCITGDVVLNGILNTAQEVTWSDVLRDLKADVQESIFFRLSKVFDRTGTSSMSRHVSIALPARSFLSLKNLKDNWPMFGYYDLKQMELLQNASVLELKAVDNLCTEIVAEISSEKSALESHSRQPKIWLIVLSIAVVVIAFLCSYFFL